MYMIMRQNQDLTEVSGYAFDTVEQALASAVREIGVPSDAIHTYVAIPDGVTYLCFAVQPVDGSTAFCREGQMTLIAREGCVAMIAAALCRRNRKYGIGEVQISQGVRYVGDQCDSVPAG